MTWLNYPGNEDRASFLHYPVALISSVIRVRRIGLSSTSPTSCVIPYNWVVVLLTTSPLLDPSLTGGPCSLYLYLIRFDRHLVLWIFVSSLGFPRTDKLAESSLLFTEAFGYQLGLLLLGALSDLLVLSKNPKKKGACPWFSQANSPFKDSKTRS